MSAPSLWCFPGAVLTVRCVPSPGQALVALLSRWCRLSSAFAVWRHRRLSSDEDVQSSIAQLDDVLDRLQNDIGFVYQVNSLLSSAYVFHLW